MTPEQFLKEAHAKHGNKFRYPSLPEHITVATMVEVECPEHQTWMQRAGSHIREGFGCRKCTNLERFGVDHPMKVSVNANDPAKKAQAKRQKTFDEKFGGHPMKDKRISQKASNTWALKSADEISKIMDKKAKTFMEKYGYDNPFSDKSIKEAIHKMRRDRGDWTPSEFLSEKDRYKRNVTRLTEQAWREYQLYLNPTNITRGQSTNLDHRYSITAGFRDQIPASVIAHPANLQLISSFDNKSKGQKCDITFEELLSKIDEWSRGIDSSATSC